MGKGRLMFFVVIVAAGAGLASLFYIYKPKPRLDSTLAPAFQLFGHVTKGMSAALTQVMPVDSLDEKEYGEAIRLRCDSLNNPNDTDYLYVNEVMEKIKRFAKKPFQYRVYMNESGSPNAFALPGGVIFVTRGLMTTLGSESELVSILAHEMAHIELSHCLDTVRFELVAKKIGSESLGKLADFTMALLLRHSFSKTQEDDADVYAFTLLKKSTYDPAAEGKAFEAFIEYCEKNIPVKESKKAHIIRDYFMSHPPLQLRAEKFTEKGRVWWEDHHQEKRYVGKANLEKKIRKDFADGWIAGGK